MSVLAILGGAPVRAEPYPAWPVHDERDVAAVAAVVRSGRWGGYPYPGPQTAELARRFAEMQGGGHAVLMVNGTVTMEVALRAVGIGWGDEVIVPAYNSPYVFLNTLFPRFMDWFVRWFHIEGWQLNKN